MLYNSEFDIKKAVAFSKDHLIWRAQLQPLTQLSIDLMVGLS